MVLCFIWCMQNEQLIHFTSLEMAKRSEVLVDAVKIKIASTRWRTYFFKFPSFLPRTSKPRKYQNSANVAVNIKLCKFCHNVLCKIENAAKLKNATNFKLSWVCRFISTFVLQHSYFCYIWILLFHIAMLDSLILPSFDNSWASRIFFS